MKKQTLSNEWVIPTGECLFKVGITLEALEEIGEIVHVHLPTVGTIIHQGEEVVVLESTKAAIDSYSPLSGQIIEVNHELPHNLQWINSDPHGRGWLFTLKTQNLDEWDALDLCDAH